MPGPLNFPGPKGGQGPLREASRYPKNHYVSGGRSLYGGSKATKWKDPLTLNFPFGSVVRTFAAQPSSGKGNDGEE